MMPDDREDRVEHEPGVSAHTPASQMPLLDGSAPDTVGEQAHASLATPHAAAGEGTPGELLRRERERRGVSIQQAAEDLHLDVATLEAIEANCYQALGAPVYAKGHLRKYAGVLGLEPAAVIERYDALGDTPEVPVPVRAAAAVRLRRELPSLKLPLLIFALLLALAAGWWLFGSQLFGSQLDLSFGAREGAYDPVEVVIE